MQTSELQPQQNRWRLPFWLGVGLFIVMATFLLWEEHRVHMFGALPYLLLLLCPLLHGLMHRGHSGSHHHGSSTGRVQPREGQYD